MKIQVEILKDFHQFKKGDKRGFIASTARGLIKSGHAKEVTTKKAIVKK